MALPSEEQKKNILAFINNVLARYQERGQQPLIIGEDGSELHTAEDIYEELIKDVPEDLEDEINTQPPKMRRARVVITDPQMVEEGTHDVLQLNRRNELVFQTILPEGGLAVNAENLNISAPDRPAYMDEPGPEEEPLEQDRVIMIPDGLPEFAEELWGDGSVHILDRYEEPVESRDDLLKMLAGGDEIYVAAGGAGQFYRYSYDWGKLTRSKNPVKAGDYVAVEDRDDIPFGPDLVNSVPEGGGIQEEDNEREHDKGEILQTLTETYGIVSAQDKDGNVYRSREEMLQALSQEGARLFLYDEDHAHAVAVRNRNGVLYATMQARRAEASPQDYDIDPGRLPENTRILNWREDQILYAQDKDGNRIEGPDKIREALQQEGSRCYLYTRNDPEYPVAVENRGGRFFMSRYTVEDKNRAGLKDTDFVEIENAGLKDEYILNFKRDEIAYAFDEDGRRYETPEAVATALYGTDKRLTLFTKESDMPYVVEKKNGRFYTSKERIPTVDQIDEEYFLPLEHVGTGRNRRSDQPEKNSLQKDFLDRHFAAGSAKDDIAFALDETGHVYRTREEIETALTENRAQLFIYKTDGEAPYAVELKDGRLSISDERITPQHRLDEDAYVPKKSLDVDDIIHRADYSKVEQAKNEVSHWASLKKFYEKNIHSIEYVKNEGKPKPPKKPEKPSLGFFNAIGYGFVWLFTFGKGDTKAHQEYVESLNNYPTSLDYYNTTTLPDYNSKKKNWDAYEKNGEERLADYRKSIPEVEKKLDDARKKQDAAKDVYNEQLRDNDVTEVSSYRSKLEVKLEGVRDLQKEGKITRNNIFANTWLKEAECTGKKASDPEARKALCGYIASRAVEEQILRDRVSGDLVNAGVETRRVEDLNSGRAYQALENDKDLNAMLDQMGDAEMRPSQIYSAYTERLATRELHAKGYKTVYNDVMKAMNFTFGEKEIDESCVDDLIRLHRLQKLYEKDKDYPLPYDEESANKQYTTARDKVRSININPITDKERKPFLRAVQALEKENKGPMKLDEMLTVVKAKDKEIVAQLNAQAESPQASKS